MTNETNLRLLKESEAAELLRCSISKVKRLRKSGKLAYLPDRPVLIREIDLKDYVEKTLRRNPSPNTGNASSAAVRDDDAFDPAEAARRIWVKERLKSVLKNQR